MKNKKNIVFIVIGVSFFIIATLCLIFIKPNKRLKLETDGLISITIKTYDEYFLILKEDFEDFIIEINTLKYKEKKTGVKTLGDYFIILEYSNKRIELGKYWSSFSGKDKPTLFKEDFNQFAEKWIEKYKLN